MGLFQNGDSAAFDYLYIRYNKRLLHFAFRMLNNNLELAEDILQDVFMKIAEKPFLFHVEREFKPWVFAIAANACKQQYRKPVTLSVEDENLDVNYDQLKTPDQLDFAAFKIALKQELQVLTYEHRCTFILRFQENLSIKEISEIMECNEGTVKSRIHYTLKKLAFQLAEFNPLKN